MTCANSVLPTYILHSRLVKHGMIANVQSEIQIVDTIVLMSMTIAEIAVTKEMQFDYIKI